MTFVALTEPDARPMRFDAGAVKGWQYMAISPNYGAAVPTDVHMPHSLNCKSINNRETKL